MDKLVVKGKEINITGISDDDYVSLTDLARFLNEDDPRYPIQNWMRLKDTIDFIGLWETINNPNFNRIEFDAFKTEYGRNSFVMTPTKWISKTNAIGFKTKAGKYGGGTFAHRDIALEFASWISPQVKLYIIKEFQRLKVQESEQIEWQGKRLLTKLNYLIHTDAVKDNLVPVELSREQKSFIYADEADLLNVALFGKRTKEWREENPEAKGNIRDYASTIELAILSNLEFQNSKLIEQHTPAGERLIILNGEANREKLLFNRNNVKTIYKVKKQ
jgi:hypothetical protein